MTTKTLDPFKLDNEVAIVTGAGAGIGRAIAELFARCGAKVAVSDLKEDAAATVADEIKAAGGDAIGLACDVTKEDALVRLVDSTVEAFGKTKVSLTFDYFRLLANEPAGAPQEIAQEFDLGIRWSIRPNLFLLGVAGIAIPDDSLRRQAGGDLDPWSTVQASLFWNF